MKNVKRFSWIMTILVISFLLTMCNYSEHSSPIVERYEGGFSTAQEEAGKEHAKILKERMERQIEMLQTPAKEKHIGEVIFEGIYEWGKKL